MKFHDQNKTPRLGLNVSPDGAPMVVFFDPARKGRFIMNANPDGEAKVEIRDRDGKTLFRAPQP